MPNFGALSGDWDHFSRVLGLTSDLLPVVSNPQAAISPQSKMQAIGKTPSRYNGSGFVAGIVGWTSYEAKDSDIVLWSGQPDYGICLQTRNVRAFDVDVPDKALAARLAEYLADLGLPVRSRKDSGKFLLLFACPGSLHHREVAVEGGIVELLANGQQCVISGTNPSGARYEFLPALPAHIPALSIEQVEDIWSGLDLLFATGESRTRGAGSVKVAKLEDAASNDPVAQHLAANGWAVGGERDGRLHITCPFAGEHTGPSSVSSTSYFPANTGGYARGHFRCLHAHCSGRGDHEYLEAVGYKDEADPQFEDESDSQEVAQPEPALRRRFAVVPINVFAQGAPMSWLVRGVIPRGEIGMVFGAGNSGKTFFTFDLACAIARGVPWRGKRTKQGLCVYVVAEGASGFRSRARAYAKEQGIPLEGLGVGVIADAPNLTQATDMLYVDAALEAFGFPVLFVVDTLVASTPGANENSGEDMGVALAHCKGISRKTGAMVVLVHHTGKDATRGARGWSGWLPAADCVIEVEDTDGRKTATVVKQKDGEKGQAYGFALPTIPIGVDGDNEEIDSCYVEADDTPPVPVQSASDIVKQFIAGETLDGLPPSLNDVWEGAGLLLPNGTKEARKIVNALTKSGEVWVEDGRVIVA